VVHPQDSSPQHARGQAFAGPPVPSRTNVNRAANPIELPACFDRSPEAVRAAAASIQCRILTMKYRLANLVIANGLGVYAGERIHQYHRNDCESGI